MRVGKVAGQCVGGRRVGGVSSEGGWAGWMKDEGAVYGGGRSTVGSFPKLQAQTGIEGR